MAKSKPVNESFSDSAFTPSSTNDDATFVSALKNPFVLAVLLLVFEASVNYFVSLFGFKVTAVGSFVSVIVVSFLYASKVRNPIEKSLRAKAVGIYLVLVILLTYVLFALSKANAGKDSLALFAFLVPVMFLFAVLDYWMLGQFTTLYLSSPCKPEPKKQAGK